MDIRLSVLLGSLAYILSFAFTGAVAFIAGIGPASSPGIFAPAAVLITIAILVLITLRYFRRVKPDAKEGFLFGVSAGIMGIVIDTIIMAATMPASPFENLVNPVFYSAVAMAIIVVTAVGAIKGRKTKA